MEFLDLDVAPELVEAYMFRLPRAYHYADYIWPGALVSPERLRQMKDFQFRPTDIVIASYPKSGEISFTYTKPEVQGPVPEQSLCHKIEFLT